MPTPAPSVRPSAAADRPAIALAIVGLLAATCLVAQPLRSPRASAQTGLIAGVGQVGGRFGDVAVADGMAWLATGPRLIALDPSDLTAGRPQAASELLPGIVRGLVVVGERAVVAGDAFGLAIVDLAPAAGPPRVMGRAAIGFDGRGVAVQGTIAVVAAADGNAIAFDLSVPALPHRLGAVALSRPELGELRPDRVALRGDRAWVTLVPARVGLPGGAIQAVDLADPMHPAAMGRLETSGVVGDIALVGSRAYLAETGIGLRVVDVAVDPPVTRGTLAPGALDGGVASGLAIAGQRLWLVGRGGSASANTSDLPEGYAWLVDLADPDAPRVASAAGLPLPAARAALAGGEVLVAQPDGALTALDALAVENPPSVHGTYVAPAVIHAAELAPAGASGRNVAWLAGGHGGLWSVDVGSPGGPRPLARLATIGQVVDVAVRGELVFALTAEPSLLLVVDGQDAELPRLLAMLPAQGRPARIAAPAGATTVLVADIDEGLQFVDVSDPSFPRLNLALRRPGYAWDVATDGARALVAAGTSGLAVLDISLLERPVVASSVPSFGIAYGVAFAGHFGLVATLEGGLAIVDTLEPYQAFEVGRYRGGQAVDVAALGGLAFMAMADEGLRVVDFRLPDRPLLAVDVALPGWTASVAASAAGDPTGGTVLASAREAGLYAFTVAGVPPLPSATPGPSITPYQTTVPTPLPTRPPRPTATTAPRPIYLPSTMAGDAKKPLALPAHLTGQLPAAALAGGELLDLVAAGDRAWVAAGLASTGAVLAVDVANPAAPRVIGRADLPVWPYGLALSGDRLYAAQWRDGVHVLDVSGAVPRATDVLTSPLWPLRLAAAPGRLVAAGAVQGTAGRLGLAVVGATGQPVADGFGRLAMDAAGARAYVADSGVGLRAYGIDGAGALADAGRFAQVGAIDVALGGDDPQRLVVLYRGDGLRAGGLLVVDPSGAPRRLGSWDADDDARGLELRRVAIDADGRCAWLTDRLSLMAVDLTDPTRPTSAGRVRLVTPIPGLALGELIGLAVTPRHVLALDRRAGLFVLERTAAPGGCGVRLGDGTP